MTSNLFVSVVVPCFNQGIYIKETLTSILIQSFKDWECIIINDGSSDNSHENINEFIKNDSRFKYIKTENLGVSNARNLGVNISVGSLILPLDADDIILPTFLEKCVLAFSEQPYLSLVYTKGVFFQEKTGAWKLPKFSFEELLRTNILPNTSMFYKTDFINVGGYNRNMSKGFEDWDLWIRMLNDKNENSVHLINEELFKYRIHNISRTHNVNKAKNNLAMSNLIVSNNVEIFSKKFGSVHQKVINYNKLDNLIKKFPVNFIVSIMHTYHRVKKISFTETFYTRAILKLKTFSLNKFMRNKNINY
jgi:glycosyltransferase involved in cell wall biosynthesis